MSEWRIAISEWRTAPGLSLVPLFPLPQLFPHFPLFPLFPLSPLPPLSPLFPSYPEYTANSSRLAWRFRAMATIVVLASNAVPP
jgi:hypothetical protein